MFKASHSTEHPALLRPLVLPGGLELSNRVVMAPMTRVRAHSDGTPSDLMAEYYAQRASAGLIIAESTAISAYGVGYFGAPGMYADSHVRGWRKVTEAVHRKGGRIFLQLNHYGRCSSHFMLPGGAQPVSASNVMISRKSRLVTVACPRVTPYDREPWTLQRSNWSSRISVRPLDELRLPVSMAWRYTLILVISYISFCPVTSTSGRISTVDRFQIGLNSYSKYLTQLQLSEAQSMLA
jgi:hypothetical protein